MKVADVVIIGGGIVGLATAYRFLQQRPGASVVVLEKESSVGRHQTGHNSGVLHTGIYYKPGSLKATNCREGKLAMERFCQEQQIPFERCGKVIVAVDESELGQLEKIHERGKANGVMCSIIDRDRLREIEPHAAGVRAIHVPEAGIVDYGEVCKALQRVITQMGGEVRLGARATAMTRSADEHVVASTAGEARGKVLVNCAGLHCDRVTRLAGQDPGCKIVPFRGEYYELKLEAQHLCKHLIYPVPDPSFPFLGVHFTRMKRGGVECGPNAVLAFAREGYTRSTVNLGDLAESLTYSGFIRLAAKHWRAGAGEMWRSFSKAAFVRALQRLMPEITGSMLHSAPAGVRAQAVRPDGAMVDDFLITEAERMVHVNNAPSPAATSSLNIGQLVAERVLAQLGGRSAR